MFCIGQETACFAFANLGMSDLMPDTKPIFQFSVGGG
jgi:hypothetical protein